MNNLQETSYQSFEFEPLPDYPKAAEEIPINKSALKNTAGIRFFRNKPALVGTFLLFFILFFAVFAPYFSSYTYYETNLAMKNTPPCKAFLFGTDDLGRDMFVRTWYGARISLFVGITAAFLDMMIGVIWGGISGYIGGKTDEMMMRIIDILYGIPYLLVVILMMVILGSGLFPIILAMSMTGWINMARIVRGQILQLKHQEFIQAAVVIGASFSRILFKHLLPNAIAPIIVTLTLTIPSAIFVESFLSFLGLGIQAPLSSWGSMASDGLPAMQYYPWRLFFPAFFISITMLAFNLISEGLRDALDPKHFK